MAIRNELRALQLAQRLKALSIAVVIEKSPLRGKIYAINRRNLDSDQLEEFEACSKFMSARLSSEMRHSAATKAVKSCEEAVAFSKALLECRMDTKLKIAVFKELNIMGYMFDRSVRNYRKCHQALDAFLDLVEGFKKRIALPDLEMWNRSTYGGVEQIPFCRGYLRGVMAGS